MRLAPDDCGVALRALDDHTVFTLPSESGIMLLLTFVLATGLTTTFGDPTALIAGGEQPDSGIAKYAKLQSPFGLVETPKGSIVFVEMTGHRVREVDPMGHIRTIAGTGKEGTNGDGGPAVRAEFNGMHALAVVANGDLYIADTWNNRVRKIDVATGEIKTIAGTGKKGFSGDGGPATSAEFGGVYSIALSSDGKLMYLADLDNRRIRAVNLNSGIVTTIAGNGSKGVPTDGAVAASAPLVDPRAVAVDSRGNVFILERGGHALRVVDRSGKISTLVGDGKAGQTGNGGSGTSARLNGPKDLIVDRDGSVLIADTENHMIRRYDPVSGTITLVAGTGRKGSAGIGKPATELELNQPHGIAVTKAGAILISDSSNHRIIKIERTK